MNMRGFILAALLGVLIAGCQSSGKGLPSGTRELERLRRENIELRRTSEVLEKRILQLQAEIERLPVAQEPREEPLQREGPTEAEKPVLPGVAGISLGIFTDSANWDGKPGDDGIVAFVTPRDSSGHGIKAAGSLLFELFDLRIRDKPFLMEWRVNPSGLEDAWVRFPPSYHFRLPWKDARPELGKLILVVKFTSATGETFSAMKQITVR